MSKSLQKPKYIPHPIHITTLGGILSAAVAPIIGSSSTYTIGKIFDYADGKVARKYNLQTNLGAVYDPLIDKLSTYSPLIYLYSCSDLNLLGFEIGVIGANLCIDSYKQIKRQNPADTIKDFLSQSFEIKEEALKENYKANTFGKWKSGFQALGTGIAISTVPSWFNIENQLLEKIPDKIIDPIQTYGIGASFSVALGLAGISLIEKDKFLEAKSTLLNKLNLSKS